MHEKLKFELVPDGCWKSNLRTLLSKDAWAFIRADAIKRADGKCAVCEAVTNRLDAHEVWEYDEITGTQKLVDVIAVCKNCHSVIHVNRTELKGDIISAENHYMKVNGASYAEYRRALGKANEKQIRLNNVSEWKLDLTWLKRFIEED